MLEGLTYRKLYAWAVYLKLRSRGPDPFVRDADKLQDWAAAIYG